MDINTLRILTMLISLTLFLVLVIRVWRRSAQTEWQAASRLIFQNETDRSDG